MAQQQRKVIPTWRHVEGYLEMTGKSCTITIESRPAYRDRGNLIAKVHPAGALAIDMDGADGWPRYYFDLERAKLECEAWLDKRGERL